jgi:NADH-quinone oxidoreductase subunit F
MKRLSSIGELEWYRNKILAQEKLRKTRIHVCMTGCRAYGASEVRDALEGEVSKQGLSDQVEVRSTGCQGLCAKAPVISIDPLGIQYQEVAPEDAAEIVGLTLKQNRLIDWRTRI